jgi:ribosomal protein S18 acetylase RimI-like enzyme
MFYLRDATSADIPALATTIAAAFEEHRGVLDPPSSSLDKSPQSVTQELQTSKAIVAVVDAKIVGCVFYAHKEDYVYLAHLAVLPEHRGLGIAKALVQEVEEKARAQNINNIRLSVRLTLEKTRGFYQSLGYVFHSHGTHTGYKHFTFVNLEKPGGTHSLNLRTIIPLKSR